VEKENPIDPATSRRMTANDKDTTTKTTPSGKPDTPPQEGNNDNGKDNKNYNRFKKT